MLWERGKRLFCLLYFKCINYSQSIYSSTKRIFSFSFYQFPLLILAFLIIIQALCVMKHIRASSLNLSSFNQRIPLIETSGVNLDHSLAQIAAASGQISLSGHWSVSELAIQVSFLLRSMTMKSPKTFSPA